ncbi:hypothetical protein FOZ60_015114 [Perkinsus olseni]|uniref:3'-5' exonuclease domain-containing protein n=1 Tax=Perkinsus olseni TaxID=32597 RepID=A0A7J6P666_PEROL|nr:hypothetical protein FOZ60_015114 [Perkinsus olseni]
MGTGCSLSRCGHPFVGIDFEWNEGESNPPVSLVQIATTRLAVLFRIDTESPVLHPVAKSILLDEKVTKIGVGMGSSDFKKVRETFGFAIPQEQTIDMLKEAEERGLEKPGLQGMCESIGYNIDKPGYLPRFYHWTAPELTRDQKLYAAGDAWFPILVAAKWGVINLDQEELAHMTSLVIKIPPLEDLGKRPSFLARLFGCMKA